MKKYIILGALGLVAASSCSDEFLEEEMVSTITQDYFLTEKGLDQLIVSTYNAERLRMCYGTELWGFEMGHDCGYLVSNADANKFSTSVWGANGTVANYANTYMGVQSKQQEGFLINCYPVVDCCNKAIVSIRQGADGKYSTDPEYAAQRLSEALFNRAYLLYSMNSLWGDIYVPTTSLTSMPDNFNYPRASSESLWSLIIGDLRYCWENLPATYSSAEYGRITKYAAAHFLAKLYLMRYQGKDYGTTEYGRRADGTIDTSNPKSYLGMLYKGQGTADLDSCIYFATQVIESGQYKLADDFTDLFATAAGEWPAEGNAEDILCGIFSKNGTGDNYRYGNRSCCMFIPNYVNTLWGIPDYTWEQGTKCNFGFFNNDFGLDVFTDKINDARFQGTFRIEYHTGLMGGTTTVPAADLDYYAYNDSKNTTYQWTADQAEYFNQNILPTYDRPSWGGREAKEGDHKMGTGDLAYVIVENTKETAIDVKAVDAQPYVTFCRWVKEDGKYYYRPQITNTGKTYSFGSPKLHYGLDATTNPRLGVATNKKWDDMNRNTYKDVYGSKDLVIFRLAETYLVRAEAYGRKGNYSAAIDDINQLRKRAAFKAGEKRAEVIARLYPGHENLQASETQYPYTVAEDCYEKIKVDASYWDGTSEKSQLEKYCPAANTNDKRFIEFIYNEYAREFNQELNYQECIHHAGIQAQRIQWHAQLGSNPSNPDGYQSGTFEASDNGVTATGMGVFQPYMTVKPFYYTFINMLTDENGDLLDDDARAAYQNYGY